MAKALGDDLGDRGLAASGGVLVDIDGSNALHETVRKVQACDRL